MGYPFYAVEQVADGRDGADKRRESALDTIGDLGAVYGVADVAFVGGKPRAEAAGIIRWNRRSSACRW